MKLQDILNASKPIIKTCWIYFLIDKEEIVYIGQSTYIEARIAAHDNDINKVFNRVTILKCHRDILNQKEGEYIAQFRPKYNKSFPLDYPKTKDYLIKNIFHRAYWYRYFNDDIFSKLITLSTGKLKEIQAILGPVSKPKIDKFKNLLANI